MVAREKKQQTLRQLDQTIRERREYLATIERDIEVATQTGAFALTEVQSEINVLNNEKARLLRQNLELAQSIRERKAKLTL